MTNVELKKEILKLVKYSDNYKIVIDIDSDWNYMDDYENYHVQANIWHDSEFSDIFIGEYLENEEAEEKVKKVVNYLKKHFNNVEASY